MQTALDTDIQNLKGIGKSRSEAFNRLGVFTVSDLLNFLPRKYEDWENLSTVNEAEFDTFVCIKGSPVCAPQLFKSRSNQPIIKTVISDMCGGLFEAVFFNSIYTLTALKENETYLFYGKLYQNERGSVEMHSPKFKKGESGNGFHGIYPLTSGLTSYTVNNAVKNAFENFGDYIDEALPSDLRSRYRLPTRYNALKMLHFPKCQADIDSGLRRLSYEELLTLQLGLKLSRSKQRDKTSFSLKADKSAEFESLLPFSLTSAQKRTVKECMADMQKDIPMLRLIQGDVGCGKTAVAASLIYSMAKNGFQSALMVPTEVLAKQHLNTFTRFFDGTGISIALLTGSSTQKQKKQISEALSAGKIDLLIGTHAIISNGVEFSKLGLAITDEQHRFGVNQRTILRNKGTSPHVLVMSATPIPRTLSLVIYGDLDISVIDEKPKGRQKIDTFSVNSSYHERLYSFIKKQLDLGKQGYIVCPLVEENEENHNERIAAESYIKELSQFVFKKYRVGLLHGKMKQKEKDGIMADFFSGKIRLLICTVVIEVGVDVPNANIMVIENAECFGLSQLHQLRGRIGRGDAKSYCVLVSDAKNENALRRFKIMCGTDDGFEIAKEDLDMRGPGDFFGSRQSGLPELRASAYFNNSKVIYTAVQDAERIIDLDPTLSSPKYSELGKATKKLFADIS